MVEALETDLWQRGAFVAKDLQAMLLKMIEVWSISVSHIFCLPSSKHLRTPCCSIPHEPPSNNKKVRCPWPLLPAAFCWRDVCPWRRWCGWVLWHLRMYSEDQPHKSTKKVVIESRGSMTVSGLENFCNYTDTSVQIQYIHSTSFYIINK